MPRVYLTEMQRQQGAVNDQRKRTALILKRAIAPSTTKDLAARIGAESQGIARRLRGDVEWDLPTLLCVANALKLDDQTRAALLGSKTRCRFEDGYKGL